MKDNNNAVKEKIGYKDIIREKEFIKYLLSKMISRFGDSIDVIAYGWMVFKLTGSAAMLATLFAVNGIPSFVFNIFTGVVVSYWDKKKVVYLCDYARGFIVLGTAILFMTGNLETWHLFVFTFLNSTFEAFRSPAATPLFKRLIPAKKYEYAVSADSMGATLMELIGYGAAGVIIGTVGIGCAIAIDAGTFLVSGIMISFIKVEKEELKKVKRAASQYTKDLVDGFKYVVKDKTVLNICIFGGMFNFFVVPFNSLQVAYVDTILEKEPIVLSIMSVTFLIAMMLGGFIAPMLKKRLSGKKMIVLSGLLISIGYVALSQLGKINQSNYLYPALISSCILMGAAIPILNLPIKVGIMTKIEGEYLPRSISLINALALSMTPIGGAIVGFIILFISLDNIYLIFGIATLLLFLVQIFNKPLDEL